MLCASWMEGRVTTGLEPDVQASLLEGTSTCALVHYGEWFDHAVCLVVEGRVVDRKCSGVFTTGLVHLMVRPCCVPGSGRSRCG